MASVASQQIGHQPLGDEAFFGSCDSAVKSAGTSNREQSALDMEVLSRKPCLRTRFLLRISALWYQARSVWTSLVSARALLATR